MTRTPAMKSIGGVCLPFLRRHAEMGRRNTRQFFKAEPRAYRDVDPVTAVRVALDRLTVDSIRPCAPAQHP